MLAFFPPFVLGVGWSADAAAAAGVKLESTNSAFLFNGLTLSPARLINILWCNNQHVIMYPVLPKAVHRRRR